MPVALRSPQIHATENSHRVVELVQSGVLDEINLVRIWMAENRFPQGRGTAPQEKPPAELDYDFWLVPAPKRPYTRLRSHRTWRYFWDDGGGHFLDFVCHPHDLVHWSMRVDAPRAVAAAGGKTLVQDDSNTPNTLLATYEYPGFLVQWSMTGINAHRLEGRGAGVIPDTGLYDTVYDWDIKGKLGTVDFTLTPGANSTKFIGTEG